MIVRSSVRPPLPRNRRRIVAPLTRACRSRRVDRPNDRLRAAYSSLPTRRLVRIVKQCQDLPGQELFQYVDEDGVRHDVESADVNEYLREISGRDFTAKDFRTWNGTVLAVRYLKLCDAPTSPTAGKRLVSGAIKSVAQDLGNTPAVARKAYVHPVVLNAYLEGSLEPEAGVAETKPPDGLTDEEQCVLDLLQVA